MKKSIAYLTLCGLLGASGMASAGSQSGNVNLFLGAKAMEESDLIADEPGELGVLIDFRQQGWPMNIALDFLWSEEDATARVGNDRVKEEIDAMEVNIGLRKVWDMMLPMHFYIGGGLAYINLDQKRTSGAVVTVNDDGDGLGYWFNGGAYWTIDTINVGLDLRYSDAEVDMEDRRRNLEGGGSHVGLVVGYHW